MKTQILRVFSLIAVLFIILGIPALLITVSGNPFASLDMVGGVIASVDGALAFLLHVFIPIIAWVGWASLVIPLVVEAVVQVRRGDSVKLPSVLRMQQNVAAVLIGMILASTAGISTATAVESGGSAGVPPTPTQTISAPATVQADYGAPSATEKVQASQKGPSYMVNGNQTLWDIAETTLGDGSRYVEIFALNQGVVQKDGAALLSSDQWLHDGWVLTLPQDAKVPQPVAGTGTVTIKPGDTLSEIALENYGDMEAYHYIAGAASTTTQPDGTTIQDADLIQPGWEFTMPGTPAAASTPAAHNGAGSSGAPASSAASSAAAGSSAAAAQAPSAQASSAAASASATPAASAASAAAGASTAASTAPSAASSAAVSADEAAASIGSSSAHGAPKAQHTTAPTSATPATPSAAASNAPAAPSAASATASTAATAQNPATGSTAPTQQENNAAIPGGTIANDTTNKTATTNKTDTTEQANETDKNSTGAQTHNVETAGSTHNTATAEDEENNYNLPLTGGALLAAGLLATFAARRWHQRRRRTRGQSRPISTEAATTLTHLEAEAATAPLAALDHGLRLLALHCHNNATPVPVLKYLTLNTTEANLYFEHDTNLPAPFQSTSDANLWTLPLTSMEIEEPLDLPAPYPALITIGDDREGAALMLNLEHAGSLQLHDPLQEKTATNTISQMLGSIAAELLLNPWAEGLHLSLLGVDDSFLTALSADRVTTYTTEQTEACLNDLTAEANQLKNYLNTAGYTSVHEARMAGADSFPAHIVIVSDTIDDMARFDLLELVRTMPNVAIAIISHNDTDEDTSRYGLNIVRTPHGNLSDTMVELSPMGIVVVPRYLTEEEEEAVLTLLAEASADPTPAPAEILHFPAPATVVADSAIEEQMIEAQDFDAQSFDVSTPAPAHTTEAAEATEAVEATDTQPVTDTTEPEQAPSYGIDTAAPTHKLEETTPETTEPQATAPETAASEEPVSETTVPQATAPQEPVSEEPVSETTAPQALAPASYEDGMTPEELRADTLQVFAHLFGDTGVYDALVKDGNSLTHDAKTNLEHPFLALLGPVRLLNANGPAPRTKGTNEPSTVLMDRYASVAAYLHLHPGMTTESYHNAFWPGEHHSSTKAVSRRNQLTGKVRQWLGSSKDHQQYLPRAVSGQYTLSELINSDWNLFQALTGEDLSEQPTSYLLAAFSLVRGVPLSGKSTHYAWAENDREYMRDRIIDVAYELLDRARTAQDHRLILQVARAARMIDSTQDAFWTAEIHEEILTNNAQKAEELKTQFLEYLDCWDAEPTEEAAKVLNLAA